MSNLKFQLSLNKHPKDCPDYSLVNAKNIRVSDDFSCLQTEESIVEHSKINQYLESQELNLISIIPCNKELVIFASEQEETSVVHILRYNEELDAIDTQYTNLSYYGGKIIGTFTYNINSELIIAFSEYDGEKDVPLKTINLGTWENRLNYEEKNLTDDQLAISPIIKVPSIENFNYVNGKSYKGWYHFFIRYKINSHDYTKWFSFGYPIFVCSLEKYSLIKYGFANKENNITTYKLAGAIDCISDNTDIAKETIKLEISDENYDIYNKCQIGFVCISNEYSKAYRTNDINVEQNITYTLDIANSIEYSVDDFIINNYNYYNVKNLVNYKNRLYISNYKENEVLDIDTKEIKIKIKSDKRFTTEDVFTQEISTFLNNNSIDNSFINIHEVETKGYKNTVVTPPLTFTSTTDFTNIVLNAGSVTLPRTPDIGTNIIKGIVTDDNNNSFSAILTLINIGGAGGSVTIAQFHINFNGVVKSTLYKNTNSTSTTINYNSGEKYTTAFTIYPNNVFIKTSNSFNERKKNTTLLPDSIYAFYIHFINKFGEYTKGYLIENTDSTYSGCDIFTNSQGKKLFKTPKSDFDNWIDVEAKLYTFYFNLENFEIPDEYIGYFFSYEKFEPRIKHEGIITKYDNFNYNSLYINDSSKKNYIKYRDTLDENLDVLHLYCPDLDIDEAFDLDFNKLRIYTKVSIKDNNVDGEEKINESVLKNLLSAKYPATYNSILNISKKEFPYDYQYFDVDIDNKDILISFAGDGKTNKFNRGTSIIIRITDELKEHITDFDWDTYDCVAQLYKESDEYYVSDEKVLNRLGNVYYNDTVEDTIEYGLPGCLTWQSILHYNYNGFKVGINNEILTENDGSYYDFGNIINDEALDESRPPLMYIHQLIYDTKFNEAKSIKNNPEYSLLRIEEASDTEGQVIAFSNNILVTPNNSIDLFRNKYPRCYELIPKVYEAYEDKTYITKFDKRIRRSNVISDESLNNSWRTFPVEGYKDISENKGNITNLIGIGTTLLAHTEHSLFMFDGSNTLKTGDNDDIKFVLPDAFDINYVEVFTSDLGVCGLQDKDAWVVGQFGYIFYDNDAHRFYKYSSGKVEIIDFDIVQFLNYAIPYEIRFANDIERNRLLIHFAVYDGVYNSTDIIHYYTLSYNYQLNKFISLHTYDFDKAVNTKNIMYLIYNTQVYFSVHDLDSKHYNIQRRKYNQGNYGVYENGVSQSPSISVIVNTQYEIMKTIEFLTYKLFVRKYNTGEDIDIINERELSKTPYSGYKIRIHNDLCDSGELNVSIDEETAKNILMNYKKPWWEFGNWNFNYLRDTKQGTSSHDIMSRIYGNYFIIDFIFYDDSNPYTQKIEFETLDVKLIVDATI